MPFRVESAWNSPGHVMETKSIRVNVPVDDAGRLVLSSEGSGAAARAIDGLAIERLTLTDITPAGNPHPSS